MGKWGREVREEVADPASHGLETVTEAYSTTACVLHEQWFLVRQKDKNLGRTEVSWPRPLPLGPTQRIPQQPLPSLLQQRLDHRRQRRLGGCRQWVPQRRTGGLVRLGCARSLWRRALLPRRLLILIKLPLAIKEF